MDNILRVDVPEVSVTVTGGPTNPHLVMFVKGDRVQELRTILHRALNTWPEGPSWAFEVCDLCDRVLEGACTNS
jgi:hypothetical protein